MIEKLKNKNNTRGAAMLIAILVFFLAALSGTVVLTMATSNAGRYTYTKEDQQAYLAVISAAQAVKSEFKDGIEATVDYVYDDAVLRKDSEVSVSASGLFGYMASDLHMAIEFIAGNRSELTTYNNGSYRPPAISEIKSVYKYILRPGIDSPTSGAMGDVAVELTINTTNAFLDFDFYYMGNGNDSYHVKMQIGGGVGSEGVVSVTYPPAATKEVKIRVQFHWNSDGATIQTAS